MDPNETLKAIRAGLRLFMEEDYDYQGWDPQFVAATGYWNLAEQVHALDEWLSKGGFPPADWDQPTTKETSK